ncbi:MAG: glycosyltransferase family 2 protein [Nitrospirae bacterium]|nr:glycosyltransferase family 2 protein [Nitrospirota bacterium]
MKTPFFSVIIPTYNRAELLRGAVRSVLDQTFKDFELIVIDDHSTDNSAEAARSFRDDRVHHIMNDRTGGSAGARNAGIFRARGQWITFLDDDDVWLPKKLEMQYKMIRKMDGTFGIIYAGYAEYDFEAQKEVSIHLPEKEGWIQEELLYTNCVTALCSVAVRRDILLKAGGFDESFPAIEDWELYVRIAGVTKFGILREKLVHVRRNDKDRLSLNFQRKLAAALLFRRKHDNLLKKSPRLCHRIATIILIWSLKLNNWSTALEAFPWTLAGILFDPYNFCKTMRGAVLIFSKSKKMRC